MNKQATSRVNIKRYLPAAMLLSLLAFQPAHALTGVNPSGVNVNSNGPTTVFLTLQGVDADEQLAGAFWCGEITVPSNTVTTFNPCVAGTLFGNLPVRNDFAQRSGTGGVSNVTDIMTIPESVVRRARQAAEQGAASSFFYVRQFVNTTTGVESFVAVTCRMAGGGARTPLSLTHVEIDFDAPKGNQPVHLIATGEKAPSVTAKIHYNGTGRITGRWEVIRPGESPPRVIDLLPEASLPVEQRALQRRYTQLSRVEVFLPPNGEAVLPGPDPARIPTTTAGPYWLLLRIEASNERDSRSDTLAGVVSSGGASGFPIPPLRYYVGSVKTFEKFQAGVAIPPETLGPAGNIQLGANQQLRFTWHESPGAVSYVVEVEQAGQVILKAIVPPGAAQYLAPPWLRSTVADEPLRWRVVANQEDGASSVASEWSEFRLE